MGHNKTGFMVLNSICLICLCILTGCRGSREFAASQVKVDESRLLPDRHVSEQEKQRLTIKTTPDGEEVIVYTLEQSIDRAVRHNIEILTVYDEYPIAESILSSAQAEFQVELRPTIDRNLAGSDGEDERLYQLNLTKKNRLGTIGDVEISEAKVEGEKSSALRFTLDQPLLRGVGKFVVNNNVINARRNIATTLRQIELEREQLVLNVISNYYDIIREKKIVALNEKSVQRTRELLEVVRQNLRITKDASKQEALKLDASRAQIQLSQAENNLINARQSLGDALDNFRILLGYAETVPIDIADTDAAYEPVEVVEAQAIDTAWQYRLDFLEARDRIWDAERNEKVAKNSLLPDLDIVVGLSGVGGTYSDALGFDDTSWFVGFTTSSDIRRIEEKEDYERARIETRNAKRSYVFLKDQIARQVRQAIRRMNRDYQQIKLQEKTMDYARQQYDLAKFRYEESQKGISDIIVDNDDLVEAEADLIRAETNLTFAITNYIISQARLKQTLGTLTEKSPEVYSMGYFDD